MLTGAHRTGKTTLAKAFSQHSGIPFVQTGASAVFAAMGMDPKVDYPMDVRLEIQKRILEAFEKQCRSVGSQDFITDRTPIDFMAYTLADVQRGNIADSLHKGIEKYLADCIDVSNSLFPILMVVQPGIQLVEEVGKAPANTSYVEHINHLIMGITVDEAIASHHFYIPRRVTSLNDRISCIEFAIQRSQEKFNMEKKAMNKAGFAMVLH